MDKTFEQQAFVKQLYQQNQLQASFLGSKDFLYFFRLFTLRRHQHDQQQKAWQAEALWQARVNRAIKKRRVREWLAEEEEAEVDRLTLGKANPWC